MPYCRIDSASARILSSSKVMRGCSGLGLIFTVSIQKTLSLGRSFIERTSFLGGSTKERISLPFMDTEGVKEAQSEDSSRSVCVPSEEGKFVSSFFFDSSPPP